QGIRRIERAIREQAKFMDEFIKNARHARAIGDHKQYQFIRNSLKKTAIIRKVLERQLLSVKNAMLIKRQAEASADFTQAMALMAELSDAFIALPGGYGTAEEFFEALTWAQLSLHAKPCALLNTKGYFEHLIRFVNHAVQEGFIHPTHCRLMLVADSPESLLDQLELYEAPAVDKVGWATNVRNDNGDRGR
ncbi:MAG TPA: TIGR00730 family Rossman fold protein, partial [Sedimentisphaerales bacterium]|nr:TIGR00730 family Rossman fold protein [Sedimentisphaerales bacterium]